MTDRYEKIRRVLAECRDIAMEWTIRGRIPECGRFGEIAQDLDAVCDELAFLARTPASVPRGWKLVPMEPTPEMVEMGCDCRISPNGTTAGGVIATWNAMLAAAPSLTEEIAARQQPAGDGCHCATCTCNPNMTPAVRFDLSPARMEGAIREHLIRLGWTPPDEHAQQPAAGVVDDTRRIRALADNYWRLEPFAIPTPGGDDADVGWRVIEFHRAEPRERIVVEHYRDNPREAIDAAIDQARGKAGQEVGNG